MITQSNMWVKSLLLTIGILFFGSTTNYIIADIQSNGEKIEQPVNPFLVKPYLQNTTEIGITIMWESQYETPGKVHYGIGDNYDNEVSAKVVTSNADTYINKAVIKNMDANTKYNYLAYWKILNTIK